MRVLVVGGSGFIGSHLCDFLQNCGWEVHSLDLINPHGVENYIQVDVLNFEQLSRSFAELKPDYIINMAARTDDSGKAILDYRLNYLGTLNIIRAITAEVKNAVFVHISTQYVEGPVNRKGKTEPVNMYGVSKLISEDIVKSSNLKHWCILRPTNVWGPRHPSFPTGFWHVLKKGRYLHPNKTVIRSYGWVGTVCKQIEQIMKSPIDLINYKSLYLGDPPMDSFLWVNAFSQHIRGKKVKRVPIIVLKSLSLVGDLLRNIGIKFPITNSRFKSMTTNYQVDLQETYSLIGYDEIDMDKCIAETSDWFLRDFKNPLKTRGNH